MFLYMSPENQPFMNKLYNYYRENGISVASDPNKKYDIGLCSIGVHKKGNIKFKVSRMDGCWFNTQIDYRKKNSSIIKSLKKANGIIYQSNFSKKLCTTYLGKFNCPTTIIFNGDDPDYYKRSVPAEKKHDINMLATAIWRPSKRLKDIIECFSLASLPNSCLYIAGDISKSGLSEDDIRKYRRRSDIVFLGNISLSIIARYLLICDAFLHLSWIDSCPNSVVEALCSGTHVVCNNISGTAEIVRPSGGYVCDIDSEFDFRPKNLNFPPKINRSIVSENIIKCVNNPNKPNIDHVNIKNIADKYFSFLKIIKG